MVLIQSKNFFFHLLSFAFLISNSVSEINSKVLNKDDLLTITIPMGSYNVFNQSGESIDSFYKISPNSTLKIILTDIPLSVSFVVLQVHSYLVSVTLSYDRIPLFSVSVSGTNVGLLKVNTKSDICFYLTYNSSVEEADVLLAVQGYGNSAPVPGGCNLEFQVEVSPFLHTTYNDVFTEVDFAPASPPLSYVQDLSLLSSDKCNLKKSLIKHEMYYQYFPERDFTKETYFKILKSMMTIGQIKKNGVIANEKLSRLPLRRIFASYPGTGKTFVVISHFGNQSAVYVPSITYACDLIKSDNCQVLTTVFSKALCASILFMGLFACFFGHYFYRTEIFLFGFLIVGLVAYILTWVFVSDSLALSVSVACGVCLPGAMLLAWGIFEIPLMSLILATLNLGFILASLMFYFLLDSVDLFVFDINFWSVFIAIMIVCPLLLIYLAEKANMIACSLLGSYMAVVSIDYYIGSNLRYIGINTIRRATTEKFSMALIAPAFQLKDVLLYCAWFLLTMSGIKLQSLLMKNKPPYPPPRNVLKSFIRRVREFKTRDFGERTPLLNESNRSNDDLQNAEITCNYT